MHSASSALGAPGRSRADGSSSRMKCGASRANRRSCSSRVAAFASGGGYGPRGEECPKGVAPIGKPVAAIAGDTVAVTPAGLFVNGVAVPNSGALATDRKGRPLARVRVARWVVESGTIWIVSSYSRFSFDSRYFGPIEVRQVRANLQRLWTAGSAP